MSSASSASSAFSVFISSSATRRPSSPSSAVAVAQTFVRVWVEFVVPDTEDVQYGGLLFCESLGQELEVSLTENSHHNYQIYCMHVNEGFHQELWEIYNWLSGRDVDKQMSGLDAIWEAMALIWMTLDQYNKDISERIARLAEPADNLVNSRIAMQEAIWISTSTQHSFNTNL
ncbi:hypothetical protein DFH08DRAFT_805487 [Mycena albidolilacea]|uniref:Uncharacterized protein n=1 Tax=Mycena albidolilacea TaxID=1033008 RepID=A0AAD7EVE9_9AGAR|nr:hypothetical protein DFH08DRAFT_805487 [Mycena albidolilacea]